MIEYVKHILDNGLTLLVHEDPTTPMATVNILCSVGARDERSGLTGFAHLFEHLMFGGTPRVPNYDRVVELMGGEANAFTNNDYTNFYVTVPATKLAEALRLEADRFSGLDWREKPLDVQKKVVTEEYKQRYINQPYGDTWLLLRPLCFKESVYGWCTIGADIADVAKARLDDVKEFYDRFYGPENIIMAVAGGVKRDEVVELVKQTFGGIAPHGVIGQGAAAERRSYRHEPQQTAARRLEVERDVPCDAYYRACPMGGRMEPDFLALDLVSDVLSNGKSSRLYNELVKGRGLFSELNAYVSGDYGEGLFVVKGMLNDGVTMDEAEAAVTQELAKLTETAVEEHELKKVVDKYEATFAFSHYKAADKATNLCVFDWMGRVDWVNSEPDEYRKVTADDLRRAVKNKLCEENSNTLYYRKRR